MLFLFFLLNALLAVWYLAMVKEQVKVFYQKPSVGLYRALRRLNDQSAPEATRTATVAFGMVVGTLISIMVIFQALAFVPMPWSTLVIALLVAEILSNLASFSTVQRAFVEGNAELLDTPVTTMRRLLGLVCDSAALATLVYAVWALAHVHG